MKSSRMFFIKPFHIEAFYSSGNVVPHAKKQLQQTRYLEDLIFRGEFRFHHLARSAITRHRTLKRRILPVS